MYSSIKLTFLDERLPSLLGWAHGHQLLPQVKAEFFLENLGVPGPCSLILFVFSFFSSPHTCFDSRMRRILLVICNKEMFPNTSLCHKFLCFVELRKETSGRKPGLVPHDLISPHSVLDKSPLFLSLYAKCFYPELDPLRSIPFFSLLYFPPKMRFHFFFLMFIYLFWEREREKIPSRLCAVSTEGDTGLDSRNCAIMTWAKIKSPTFNWLSHPDTSSLISNEISYIYNFPHLVTYHWTILQYAFTQLWIDVG